MCLRRATDRDRRACLLACPPQAEFKATHKQVDQTRNTDLRPGELRTEIGQLEDEKKQLMEKISKLKANVSEEPGACFFGYRGGCTGRCVCGVV